MKRITMLIAALALLLGGVTGEASAGLIVVSGDENICNGLDGSGGFPVFPGNQTFFKNILGSGHSVLVQGTDPGGVDTPVAITNAFYNSVPGVTSSILAGPVTAAALAGKDLFVSALPAVAFTPSEVAALSAFSAAGGTLFLMGDWSGFGPGLTADGIINSLLTALGSPLHIIPAADDLLLHIATGAQIAVNPLTAGVT